MEYFPEYSHKYTLETNNAVLPLANFTAVYVVRGARTALFFSYVYSAATHLVVGKNELNSSVDLQLCEWELISQHCKIVMHGVVKICHLTAK
jgi:hypothetical protein